VPLPGIGLQEEDAMIPASIERFLTAHHVSFTPVRHVRAFTAQEEAAVTHTPGRMWAKTVICLADNEPVQAVLPADRVLEPRRLRELTGARVLRIAEEDEFAELYPDCDTGAMPPFGQLYGQRVFVDETLAADPEIVFNGGTHTDAIRMRYADFDRLVHPILGTFSRRAAL
jgi:Ala-tRNA(Pro) deacylase